MNRRKESAIRLYEDHAEVELTQGRWALIDLADVPLVAGFCWTLVEARYNFYAIRRVQGYPLGMHRALMGLQKGDRREVDHRNNNGLDNRRANLLVVPPLENQRRGARKFLN